MRPGSHFAWNLSRMISDATLLTLCGRHASKFARLTPRLPLHHAGEVIRPTLEHNGAEDWRRLAGGAQGVCSEDEILLDEIQALSRLLEASRQALDICRACWRRGRDSNPRYGCPYFAFRVRRIRPLCHLSADRSLNFDGRAGLYHDGGAASTVIEDIPAHVH